MDAAETVVGLSRFRARGPGTDAERRAARWLADRLRAGGRDADLEVEWVRPQHALVLALHAFLGVAGSIVAAVTPVAGVAIVGAALLSLVLDLTGRLFLLRRLTPQRATQNVVSPPPRGRIRPRAPVRLVVAAAYDTGRGGIVHRDRVLRLAAGIRARLGGRGPGAGGMLALTLLLAGGAAAMRLVTEAQWVGLAQLVPTVVLLVAFAALLDIALGVFGPGAGDASAAGVALALAAALDESPPRRLDVHVVLAGAGAGPALGMRGFVRRRRRWAPERTAVLALEPCARGTPRWWTQDGALFPLRFHPRLRELAEQVSRDESHLHARAYRGHGVTQGYPARVRRWPAIAVGCLEEPGWRPAHRQVSDTVGAVDPEAMRAAVEFSLALVYALDDDLARLDEEEDARTHE